MSETGERPHQLSSQSGTTLIEALVVVAITTMIALIGFPRLQQGVLILSQRQTVSIVAAQLRQSRAEALLHDHPVVFAVAADGRAFGAPGRAATATPPGVSLTARQSAGARIVFYGDGSSSGGEIWIRAAGRAMGVAVAPPGGAVSVVRD